MSEETFATPQEAEEAFYDAFQRADADAMMRVWADDDGIVCIHPMGARLQGRAEVEASWRQILGGGTSMRFELSDVSYTQDTWLSIHCLHENIAYGPRLEHRSQVIATNVYKLTDDGWRMIVHHASQVAGEEEEPEEDVEPPRTVH